MANVGSGDQGKTLIGAGNGSSPTFASIGTNSGLTAHGVVISEGNGAFVSASPGSSGLVLTSNGAGLDPSFQPASASGSVITITGNTGTASPVLGNIDLLTDNTTVEFVGSGSTLTQDFGLTNLLIGSDGSSITSGTFNVGLGNQALRDVTSGLANVAVGYNSGLLTTTSNANTSIGHESLSLNLTSSSNVAVGSGTLQSIQSGGGSNVAVGTSALNLVQTGHDNVAIGELSGSEYLSSESSNILISNVGTQNESNTIRIGTQGTGDGEQNSCYISGIVGVTVANPVLNAINSSTGEMGVISSASNSILSTNSSNVPSFGTSLNNNYTFTTSTANTSRILTVSNTDNTNAFSNAISLLSVGGTSSGDPFSRYLVGTSRSYAWGIDNNDSQSFKMSTNAGTTATPSSGTITFRMDTSGNVAMPLNACCTADLNTGLTNQTGDGTTVSPIIFDTDTISFFDQNSNYNTGTGIFTANATGKYLVSTSVTLNNLGASHTSGLIIIILNGSSYAINQFNPGVSRNSSNEYTATITCIVPVSATGTLSIAVQVSGSTKTVGIKGNSFGSYSRVSFDLIS